MRFLPCEGESEEVNPGRFGKRLAQFLAEALRREGEPVAEIFAEDWGWVVPIQNPEFRLWVGVGNYEEYPDGFLCFIEPHRDIVRRLWKKIPTRGRIEALQQRLDRILQADPRIRAVRWWTHEEFNTPSARRLISDGRL